MRPTRIVARDFLSHEDLDLDLADIHSAVLTGPVGAGKSAIIEALTWALYGETRAPTLDALIRDGADSTTVTVECDVEGEHLLVTRSKTRGKDATLALAVDGEQATWHTSAETKAALTAKLGIDYDALLAGPLMTQADDGALMRVQPRERKELLFRLFRLGQWAEWEEKARAEAATAKANLTGVERSLNLIPVDVADRLAASEHAVGEYDQQLAENKPALEAAQQQQAGLREQLGQLKARGERAKTVQRQLDEARDRFAKEAAAFEEAKRTYELRETEHMLFVGQPPPKPRADYDEFTAHVAEESAALHAARATLDILRQIAANDQDVTCPHCGKSFVVGSSVPPDHVKAAAADVDRLELGYRLLADEAGDAVAVKQRHEKWEREVPRYESRKDQAQSALDAARSRAGDTAATGRQLKAEMDALEAVLDTLEGVELELVAVGEQTIHLGHLRDVIQTDRERALTLAGSYREAMYTRNGLLADGEKYLADLEVLTTLAKAFGRDGIPTMILESVVPVIEERANEVLAKMPGDLSVRLRTQKLTQKGTTAETLDIVTLVGDSAERDYAMLSGGQKFRVDLALRLGLTAVLAHRQIDTLIIDEGLDRWQDPEGRAAVLDTVGALSDDFALILVVSHNAEVVERFEHRIEVAQEGGVSHVTLQ